MNTLKISLVLALIAITQIGWTQNTLVNHDTGIGIQGYDPVAYFLKNRAIKGDKKADHLYQGITYYFSSKENSALFMSEPEKYLPQYGGWCAFAMVEGDKVRIDPETFKVKDGKLYLFYNFYFNNTLKSWNEDEANLLQQADKHWAELVK